MQFAFAPERADDFSPCACWQLLEFAFAPERTDGIQHLSVLTNLALSVLTTCAVCIYTCACRRVLHLSVLMNFAPERADKVCNFAFAPVRADEICT